MKTQFLLLVLPFSCILLNAQKDDAHIMNISKGQIIKNRTDFEVSLTIDNYNDSNGYYWLAVASCKEIKNTDWNKTLTLYEDLSRSQNNEKLKELVGLISLWEIEKFWPKFYIKNRNFTSRVFDGGNNPLSGLEPQPIILIVLKIDDALNNYFRQWFRNGSSGKGYPGISIEELSNEMILTRCEIFFP